MSDEPHSWLSSFNHAVADESRVSLLVRLTQAILDNTVEGIMITDAQARLLQVNAAFTEITGYSQEEVLGQTPKMLRSNHHGADFYTAMWQAIAERNYWQGEIWNRRKDRSVYLQWLSIHAVRDAEGRIEHYLAVFHDLTEQRARDQRIQQLVTQDPLTGLGNRLMLDDRLRHAMNQAISQKSGLALMCIDLGNIQLLNNSLGHSFCDHFIRHQSEQLRRLVREVDTLVRTGADEFVLLLEDVQNTHDVVQLAKRIQQALQQSVEIEEQLVSLSPSIGIAFYSEDATTPDLLFSHAQSALADAKRAGRDTFRLFDSAMGRQAQERLVMEQALRHAVRTQSLQLHYQPKVCLDTAQLIGAEALLRWESPEMGSISPSVFIPLAEESGLIVEIGAWVIEEVVRTLADWKKQGLLILPVAVNIAVRQLELPGFANWLAELLQRYQLNVTYLELEITETGVITQEKQVLDTLHQLKALGFRIALDDFGTGYSSLSYLKHLPISILKLDRSFVVDLKDQTSQRIVQTIVQLAQNLELEMVAEGVETPEQAQQLLALNCQYAQGFYFFHPLNLEAFYQLVLHTCNPVP